LYSVTKRCGSRSLAHKTSFKEDILTYLKITFNYHRTSVSGIGEGSSLPGYSELSSLFIDVAARNSGGTLSLGGARKSYLKVILKEKIKKNKDYFMKMNFS
jgi:hypothetical protein